MDLHVSAVEPSDEERAAIDELLGPPQGRWDGGPRASGIDAHVALDGDRHRAARHQLLPALHALNDRVGWISEGGLNYVCRRLTVPPAEAYGVASFYHMFSLEPRPRSLTYVCDDIGCMVRGAETLCAQFERGDSAWERSPCLGLCDRAPAALSVDGRTQTELAPFRAPAIRRPAVGSALFARTASFDGTLASYRKSGGYAALARALEIGPDAVIREVIDSKLLGRGGAAFPTGRKWEAVAAEPARPRYAVCNADESEPGTFKDLALMTADPFAIVEALTIAGFAGGCERGYIYVRGEYGRATDALESALRQARDARLLGAAIMGKDFAFDIEVRRGAGAYICGEETALFNSIEGYRGEPRNKPPYPVQRGLFGKPTIVNNVETLANIPQIVLHGGKAFAAVGTPESTGTKLFCLSGNVEKPGVYEVTFGATLRQLIDMAGGVAGGRKLQAVLLGGAAGTFLKPDELDLPLTFEGTRAAKASLGSGVIMLFDDTVDLRKIVERIARFFRDESCGQCVPCRIGSVRQEELVQRGGADKLLLREIGMAMRDASICGLGQTASSAIESAAAKFDLFGTGSAR